MTKVVTITRYHSGFDNVADSFELGDHDNADTSVERYQLPKGYWVDRERGVIIDPKGYDCTILPIDTKGEPQLISLSGPCPNAPMVKDSRYPVLDDNTRDANIIGYASDEGEAAEVFMTYMRDRMDAADFADLARPQFAYRARTSVASPAFEPLF